jgi:hypothetical protein
MYVCVRLFRVCGVLCVGSGLATDWSPVQGVQPTTYRIRKLKKRPRPNEGVESHNNNNNNNNNNNLRAVWLVPHAINERYVPSEDVGVDRRIILKWKQWSVWNGLLWRMLNISGGLLWTWCWICGFYKMWEIYLSVWATIFFSWNVLPVQW